MVLYQVTVTLLSEISPDCMRELKKAHAARSVAAGKYYLTAAEECQLQLCQMIRADKDAVQDARAYLEAHAVPVKNIRQREIGIGEVVQAMVEGHQAELCPAVHEVCHSLPVIPFFLKPFCEMFTEATLSHVSKADIGKGRKEAHSRSLDEELERIRAGEGHSFHGHPVLYGIATATRQKNDDVLGVLLSSLRMAGRLQAARVTFLNPFEKPLPEKVLQDIYCAQEDATVVVDLFSGEKESKVQECIDALLSLAKENRKKVLTVFRAVSEDDDAQRLIRDFGKDFPLVTLTEDPLTRQEAKKLLAAKARSAGYGQAGLAAMLPQEKQEFSEAEALQLYQEWENKYLCSQIYPQYAAVTAPKTVSRAAEPERPSALQELQQLIGLEEVKRIIGQAVDFVKMQQLCKQHGLPTESPHLHMVFTGNPGTAKTTVARLAARIFKECGVLSKGELVEVCRGELVGKYEGWTANQVKEKFRRAEGSVLFIDEAYSLLEDSNSFGDEAINAIVQEMENCRDTTVVIFAGYRDRMEQFLDRNPGLRSRISYTVHFPDYSENELMEILHNNLTQKSKLLAPGAREKAYDLIRAGMEQKDFGNGRYVRRMVERATFAQASRLAALPQETITSQQLQSLCAEDFVAEEQEKKTQLRAIGFCA